MDMKNIFLISFTALALLSCNDKKDDSTKTEQKAPTTEVKISNHIVLKAGDDMRFDQTEFTVKAGEEVTLILMNSGEMSKAAMGHNFVLLQAGVDGSSFASSAASSKATEYIPTELKNQIIAHTKLLGGKENDQIKFTLEAGTYEFLCSFPGHYGSMNGKINAVK